MSHYDVVVDREKNNYVFYIIETGVKSSLWNYDDYRKKYGDLKNFKKVSSLKELLEMNIGLEATKEDGVKVFASGRVFKRTCLRFEHTHNFITLLERYNPDIFKILDGSRWDSDESSIIVTARVKECFECDGHVYTMNTKEEEFTFELPENLRGIEKVVLPNNHLDMKLSEDVNCTLYDLFDTEKATYRVSKQTGRKVVKYKGYDSNKETSYYGETDEILTLAEGNLMRVDFEQLNQVLTVNELQEFKRVVMEDVSRLLAQYHELLPLYEEYVEKCDTLKGFAHECLEKIREKYSR